MRAQRARYNLLMRTPRTVVILVVIVVVFGCKKAESIAPSRAVAPSAVADEAKRASAPAAGVQTQGGALAAQPEAEQKALPSRMIIRTATVSLVVRDAAATMASIAKLADAKGGYVADSKQWRENDNIRASLTVRVPAEQLSPMLDAIRHAGVRVDSESVTGQDVSEEFSDLGAQLKNLQATEAELRDLLGTVRQRTQKAADILEVYNQLTKIRGEIERIQGRMRYLGQMTALSTINLELIPDAITRPVVESGWRPLVVVRSAGRALVETLKWLASAAIWIGIYFLPIGLLIALAIALLRRLIRLARRDRKASPTA
jgi:Sec-independent protein translocase protein TatA